MTSLLLAAEALQRTTADGFPMAEALAVRRIVACQLLGTSYRRSDRVGTLSSASVPLLGPGKLGGL
jgi:hypothetical protein